MVPAAFDDVIRAEPGPGKDPWRSRLSGQCLRSRLTFSSARWSQKHFSTRRSVSRTSVMWASPLQKHFSSTYNAIITGERAKTYREEEGSHTDSCYLIMAKLDCHGCPSHCSGLLLFHLVMLKRNLPGRGFGLRSF